MAKAKKKVEEKIEVAPKAKAKGNAKSKLAPAPKKEAAVSAVPKAAPPAAAAAPKPSAKSNTKSSKGQNTEVIAALDRILEAELSGVVRYLHYSFMIFGPNRIPITKWFREHALEGFQHAVTIGEKITALGGHPSIKVEAVPESNKHNVMEILKESIEFERETLTLYHDVLGFLNGDIALEEMIRGLIHEETSHIEEVEKMIRGGK